METITEEKKSTATLDLAAVRAKLAGKSGQAYWRTLEEVADTPEFRQWVDDEFPNRSSLIGMNRRDLLKFMGAGMALAGLGGCRSIFLPQDKVVPYVRQPEELVPGVPLFYASSVPFAGYGIGVLVEQHEGRPIKLEGNPLHPASLGAIDTFTQAELLNLYDPDRASEVRKRSESLRASGGDADVSTWPLFTETVNEWRVRYNANQGAGLRILTGSVTSPTVVDQIRRLLTRYPRATWHTYETISQSNIHGGARLSYGRPLEPIYDFTKAEIIVSLDACFLSPENTPGSLRYARDFAGRRRVKGKQGQMNRLYAFESVPTITGTMADHRWPVKAGQVRAVADALLAAVSGVTPETLPTGIDPAHFGAMVRDLQANRGRALVVPGLHQPAEVHALANLINLTLGANGQTVRWIESPDAAAGADPLANLVTAMNDDKVDTLLMFDRNPCFDAPVDLKFQEALLKVPHAVLASRDINETGAHCEWELPLTHPLEEWGDTRAFDGTVAMTQPLIAPLFDGRSAAEIVGLFLGEDFGGYEIVRRYWSRQGLGSAGRDFEKAWRTLVHDGVLANSAAPSVVVAPVPLALAPAPVIDGIELNFRPDPGIYDGRYANNGWLQELPNPMNKLTWDNCAQMSPATAQKLGLGDKSAVRLTLNDVSVEATVLLQPGQAEDTVAVTLGYGRRRGGSVATVRGDDGGGFDAYVLRTQAAPWFTSGLEVTSLGYLGTLASTQGHNPLGGDRMPDEFALKRDVIRETTLAEFNRDYNAVVPEYALDPEYMEKYGMYPDTIFEYNGSQWGMTVDMNTCVGCNACVTACQAENNISVVGKMQVEKNREMHWIRIDRYYKGDDANPSVVWQPMMCVHCEKAPCEPVCPVAATVHSHEGLNQMVYNRCVGTRYCSNNCAYKVRKFNYLNYTDNQPNFSNKTFSSRQIPGPLHSPKNNGIPLLKLLNNPDVTLRGRGIMEKCTYCVQRINNARKEAKKLGQEIKDGDIVTACQQACPTEAIIFGDLADKNSRVSQWHNDPRAWLLLHAELLTKPRTAHLAKLRNPNPEIEPVPPPRPPKKKDDEHASDEAHDSELKEGAQ